MREISISSSPHSGKKKMQEPVAPGMKLGSTLEYQPFKGTFVKDSSIYSSLLGYKTIVASSSSSLPLLQVVRKKQTSGVPQVDSMILGQVIRINPRFATVSIQVVDGNATSDVFYGIIRSQDIRSTDKETKVSDSFRPGDLIKALVISLGDSKSHYYLSTARNDLGVFIAKSLAGNNLVPISWEEMIDQETRLVEKRKCAQPSSS